MIIILNPIWFIKFFILLNFLIIFKKEIAASKNPQATLRRKVKEFRERFANPYIAAERGYIDDVTEPHQTRPTLIRAFRTLATKVDSNPKKKHGNIPL